MRTIVWYTCGWIALVITYPLIWVIKLLGFMGKPEVQDRLTVGASTFIAKYLFYLTGSRIEISGLENIPEGAVLFVCNHQGHVDSLVFQGFINKPKGFVSIIGALDIPIIRTWMRYMKCVFMDRSDMRQTSQCLNEATQNLKNGHSMVVFPEGRLSDCSQINEFNNGWFRLAARSGVPIVPVSIDGTYKVMSKSGKSIKPYRVKCVVSKPIVAQNVSKQQQNQIIENIRNTIADAVSQDSKIAV